MKVLVIGAGPAGLSCAYELVKNGIDVEVYESGNTVGGMAQTIDLWNQRVDLGPHRFFSKEQHVNRFFKELIQDNYTLVSRKTRIYYNQKFFDYPLKLGNVITNLPFKTIFKILWDYLKIRVSPIKNPNTFEDWVTNRFGKTLFKTFFKSYSEKLWGIPCNEINADWAAQRIKSLSLIAAILNALKGNKNNEHKTLVDQFAYPKNGTGELYNRCAQAIKKQGGKIHLKTGVKRVLIEGKSVKGVELENGNKVYGDYVISSMPLTNLVNSIPNLPSKIYNATNQLSFRNTILVYLEINATDLFDDNWLYIHSPNVKHGRITNFRNWCPSLYKNSNSSILCLEFWAFDSDDIWHQTEDYISELAKKEITQLKLTPTSSTVKQSKVIRIPKCYPVYDLDYRKHLNLIENYLDGFNGLLPIGRYGAFKYNNQDHSILMGILAAEKICNKSNVRLWDINTDTEYQEEGKVKDVLIH